MTDGPAVDSRTHSPTPRVRPRVIVLALWLGTAIGAWIFARARGMGPEAVGLGFVHVVSQTVWGPALYVGAYVARLAFLFSATVLTLAGGFLFGPLRGTLLTVLAANLSAVAAYYIGRRLGAAWISEDGPPGGDRFGAGRLHAWRERMQASPFEAVLVMRLIYLPFDGVSIVAGALRLPLGAFVLATMIGTLPGTVQFVLFGASLESFRLAEPGLRLDYAAAGLGLGLAGLLIARFVRGRTSPAELAV